MLPKRFCISYISIAPDYAHMPFVGKKPHRYTSVCCEGICVLRTISSPCCALLSMLTKFLSSFAYVHLHLSRLCSQAYCGKQTTHAFFRFL
jgi:hypothetical protein